MQYDLEAILNHVDEHLDASIDRLKDILRIPSVSTDPKFDDDVHRCAEHMGRMLEELGMDTTVPECA